MITPRMFNYDTTAGNGLTRECEVTQVGRRLQVTQVMDALQAVQSQAHEPFNRHHGSEGIERASPLTMQLEVLQLREGADGRQRGASLPEVAQAQVCEARHVRERGK
jgi:hypothetical protein